MSPALRAGVTLFAAQTESAVLTPFTYSHLFLFSSKSISVVPVGFWTRSQARYRKMSPFEPFSCATYMRVRSLFWGGIEPAEIVGETSSSFPPRESSLCPDGL